MVGTLGHVALGPGVVLDPRPGDRLFPQAALHLGREDQAPNTIGDMHDVALIMPDEHGRYVSETLIRQGLSDGPHSPTWLNYLRIEGMFTEKAKDFVHLNQMDQERNAREGPSSAIPPSPGQEPPSFAPGASAPIPVAPAAGPPQSNGGGGAGSYGPY